MFREIEMRIIDVVQKETPLVRSVRGLIKPWPLFFSRFESKIMQVKATHPAREALADAVSNLLFFADTRSSFSYNKTDLVEMCGRLLNAYFKNYPNELLIEGIFAMAEMSFDNVKNNSVVWVLRNSLTKLSGEEDPLRVWDRAISRHKNKMPQNFDGSNIPDIIWKLTKDKLLQDR